MSQIFGHTNNSIWLKMSITNHLNPDLRSSFGKERDDVTSKRLVNRSVVISLVKVVPNIQERVRFSIH